MLELKIKSNPEDLANFYWTEKNEKGEDMSVRFWDAIDRGVGNLRKLYQSKLEHTLELCTAAMEPEQYQQANVLRPAPGSSEDDKDHMVVTQYGTERPMKDLRGFKLRPKLDMDNIPGFRTSKWETFEDFDGTTVAVARRKEPLPSVPMGASIVPIPKATGPPPHRIPRYSLQQLENMSWESLTSHIEKCLALLSGFEPWHHTWRNIVTGIYQTVKKRPDYQKWLWKTVYTWLSACKAGTNEQKAQWKATLAGIIKSNYSDITFNTVYWFIEWRHPTALISFANADRMTPEQLELQIQEASACPVCHGQCGDGFVESCEVTEKKKRAKNLKRKMKGKEEVIDEDLYLHCIGEDCNNVISREDFLAINKDNDIHLFTCDDCHNKHKKARASLGKHVKKGDKKGWYENAEEAVEEAKNAPPSVKRPIFKPVEGQHYTRTPAQRLWLVDWICGNCGLVQRPEHDYCHECHGTLEGDELTLISLTVDHAQLARLPYRVNPDFPFERYTVFVPEDIFERGAAGVSIIKWPLNMPCYKQWLAKLKEKPKDLAEELEAEFFGEEANEYDETKKPLLNKKEFVEEEVEEKEESEESEAESEEQLEDHETCVNCNQLCSSKHRTACVNCDNYLCDECQKDNDGTCIPCQQAKTQEYQEPGTPDSGRDESEPAAVEDDPALVSQVVFCGNEAIFDTEDISIEKPPLTQSAQMDEIDRFLALEDEEQQPKLSEHIEAVTKAPDTNEDDKGKPKQKVWLKNAELQKEMEKDLKDSVSLLDTVFPKAAKPPAMPVILQRNPDLHQEGGLRKRAELFVKRVEKQVKKIAPSPQSTPPQSPIRFNVPTPKQSPKQQKKRDTQIVDEDAWEKLNNQILDTTETLSDSQQDDDAAYANLDPESQDSQGSETQVTTTTTTTTTTTSTAAANRPPDLRVMPANAPAARTVDLLTVEQFNAPPTDMRNWTPATFMEFWSKFLRTMKKTASMKTPFFVRLATCMKEHYFSNRFLTESNLSQLNQFFVEYVGGEEEDAQQIWADVFNNVYADTVRGVALKDLKRYANPQLLEVIDKK